MGDRDEHGRDGQPERREGGAAHEEPSGVWLRISKEADRPREPVSVLRRRAHMLLQVRDADDDQARELAGALRRAREYGLARRLLEKVIDEKDIERTLRDEVGLRRDCAWITARDLSIPIRSRLDRAWQVLDKGGMIEARSRDVPASVYEVAGSIRRRGWEAFSRLAELKEAAELYDLAYELRMGELDEGEAERAAGRNYGYAGVNASLMHDLVAAEYERQGDRYLGESARLRRERSARIREQMLERLSGEPHRGGPVEMSWWRLVNRCQALFGLGRFREAEGCLSPALEIFDAEAQRAAAEGRRSRIGEPLVEILMRQLMNLERLRAEVPRWSERGDAPEGDDGDPDRVVFLPLTRRAGREPDEDEAAAVRRSMLLGKVGLALSGGGLRASYFHLGVLACLADLDLLRHVEVISCVSGGSILGAYYFQALKDCIESCGDDNLSKEQYRELVRRTGLCFHEAAGRNLRVHMGLSARGNARIMHLRSDSVTHRVRELLDELLFTRVAWCGPDGADEHRERAAPPYLEDMVIQPGASAPEGSAGSDFEARRDNWSRGAKVPLLVLNATTLNTGHNWQFTAWSMGEPPASIEYAVDGNARLRRMRHDQVPEDFDKVLLSEAVIASAGVPVVFEPFSLGELYERREGDREPWDVRLLDGGLFDNQGVSPLIEEGCKLLVVSDASGQLSTVPGPDRNPLSVWGRSSEILMERIRQSQYRELKILKDNQGIRDFAFLHLKRDLGTEPINWRDAEDRKSTRLSERTEYLFPRDVLRALSMLRTDLDSFTDIEADTLRAAGYNMARHYVSDMLGPDWTGEEIDDEASLRDYWGLGSVESRLETRTQSERLAKELRGGRQSWSNGLRLLLRPDDTLRLLRSASGPGERSGLLAKLGAAIVLSLLSLAAACAAASIYLGLPAAALIPLAFPGAGGHIVAEVPVVAGVVRGAALWWLICVSGIALLLYVIPPPGKRRPRPGELGVRGLSRLFGPLTLILLAPVTFPLSLLWSLWSRLDRTLVPDFARLGRSRSYRRS